MKLTKAETRTVAAAMVDAIANIEGLIDAHKRPHLPGFIDEPFVAKCKTLARKYAALRKKALEELAKEEGGGK